MTSLRDLLERVEGATDRLDDEILGRLICAAYGVEFGSADIGCGDDGSDELSVYCKGRGSPAWSGYRHLAPDVSVDAALALIGRVLPEAEFELCYRGGALRCARWWSPARNVWVVYEKPLALCAALIAAKIEQEGINTADTPTT